jgi:hypothetical protein
MEKSIAILTMHAVINYGSLLQAYALYKFLEINGYSPVIVNYIFPNDYHKKLAVYTESNEDKTNWVRAHTNGICNRIIKPNSREKIEKFGSFMCKNMKLTHSYNSIEELKSNPPIADLYIAGSDQIWNPKYIGNDDSFFLTWAFKGTKVSYASSFGSGSLSVEFKNRLKNNLSKFSYISVREKPEEITSLGLKTTQVLDPIFLLDKNQWKTLISDKPIVEGKYILCYLLGYSFNPFPYAYEVIRKLKKETGYNVVMIGGEPLNILKGYKLFNDCGPAEFLNLFYYSSYVITSSFHGTAFAINFNKPFVTIVDDKKNVDNRQKSVVQLVDANIDSIIIKNSLLSDLKIQSPELAYASKLGAERENSRDYLLNACCSAF